MAKVKQVIITRNTTTTTTSKTRTPKSNNSYKCPVCGSKVTKK